MDYRCTCSTTKDDMARDFYSQISKWLDDFLGNPKIFKRWVRDPARVVVSQPH